MRSWFALALAAIGLCAVHPCAQVFRLTTDAVSVDVSVRDGNKPVTGLTADDFTLSDNGVSQTIQLADVEQLPVDVTLLLDTSGSVEGKELEALKAAVTATAHLLTPRDALRLITFSSTLHQVFDFHPGGEVPPLEDVRAGGSTVLYDGLVAAMLRAHRIDRRHLIIAFTDGLDTRSWFDFDSALPIARGSDAVVQIVIGRLTSLPVGTMAVLPNVGIRLVNTAAATRIAALGSLASATGGALMNVPGAPPGGLDRIFKTVLDDFRTSYILAFTPTGVSRTGWHDLIVTLKKPGKLLVRARKGYVGGGS